MHRVVYHFNKFKNKQYKSIEKSIPKSNKKQPKLLVTKNIKFGSCQLKSDNEPRYYPWEKILICLIGFKLASLVL